MSSSFTNTQLYGGAIVALIPSHFADVSTIRQVPDNQEVYLDTNGFTSLTFDISERVSHLSTDQEALEYHFSDIVAEGDSREVISTDNSMQLPNFPHNTPVLSLIAEITPPPNPNPRPTSPSHTTIFLTLIRLVEQATDIVITLNVPIMAESSKAQDESAIREVVSKVTTSFEVKDWNLFDGE